MNCRPNQLPDQVLEMVTHLKTFNKVNSSLRPAILSLDVSADSAKCFPMLKHAEEIQLQEPSKFRRKGAVVFLKTEKFLYNSQMNVKDIV